MRFFINSGLFLALSFFGLLAQENGTLSITSKPADCWVRVDSVLVGKTPLYDFQVSPGLHAVKVYPPNNRLWNIEEKSFAIEIEPGENIPLKAIFNSPVHINSIPYGASLFTDTTLIGMTPVYIPFEPNRGKAFRLIKKGYQSYQFTLNSNESIMARLQEDEAYAKAKENTRFLGIIPRKNLSSKFTLLAVTVASNWASFYFKNVADSNFKKYEQSADAAQREKFLDQTEKYDRLSEIALGVSLASLAGLVYLVIWH